MRILKFIVTGAAAFCSIEATTEPGTTGRDYRPLFDQLWTTTNDKLFDPRMNGVDWKAVRARYAPQVAAVRTDEEFQALGTRMLGELKVSHVRLDKPTETTHAVARPWGYLPARVLTLDGKVYVREVRPEGTATGLKPGDLLLTPAAARFGTAGRPATVEVEGCDGLRRKIDYTLTPIEPVQQWNVRTSPGGERLGYYRLDRFNPDMIAGMDQAMASVASTEGLIIDLRQNNGGDSAAMHLLDWFTEGSRPSMIIFSREALAKLGRMPTPSEVLSARKVLNAERQVNLFTGVLLGGGRAAAWTQGRGAAGYRKPVTVLIGPRTGSSGEAFAWGMKLLSPARLIGRTSAGALLSSDSFDLPNGWAVTLPTYGLWGPDGASYVDRPVTPHEPVATTRADLCAERDPDMTAALRYHDKND